jgi:hypothetical protein
VFGGPSLLNEHPREATPRNCPNSNKATDRKNILSRTTRLGDLIAATSIPSNAWSVPSTGCKRVVIPLGVLRQWHTLTLKASPCGAYQRDSKVKRGKTSFGSKEGLMQTSASGLMPAVPVIRALAAHTPGAGNLLQRSSGT